MDFQQQNQPEASNEQPSGYNTQPVETPVPNQESGMQQQSSNPEPAMQQQLSNPEPAIQQQPSNPEPAIQQQSSNPEPAMQQQLSNPEPAAQQQPSNQGTGAYNQQTTQGQLPYGHGSQMPNQNNQPYKSNNNIYQNPYQNPYQGNNMQQGNTSYNSPYQNSNGYPYYNRSAYQLPHVEPGSSFANAAMILGIISIIFCFTFTVYPAFILGSIAIVLALLSKGSRSAFLDKAKTGIICGTIGLVTNTILVTSIMVMLFTNSELRDEVNKTFEKQYGITFDEMIDEILEENGYSE